MIRFPVVMTSEDSPEPIPEIKLPAVLRESPVPIEFIEAFADYIDKEAHAFDLARFRTKSPRVLAIYAVLGWCA